MENANNNTERLRFLFEKDSWTDEERRWLLEYLDAGDDGDLRQLMEDQFRKDAANSVPDAATSVPHPDQGRLLSSIQHTIWPVKYKGGIYFLWTRKWFSAAALLILSITGVALYLLYQGSAVKKGITASHAAKGIADAAPGRNTALLTLADGTSISLDSAANGGLAQQGNTRVEKINGQIAYTNSGDPKADGAPLYNTISTARGNQYQLVLSDGSKVWLNAASSVRFPASFKGRERKVEITGEAYFEVVKNPAMPFRVLVNGGEIDVLGTHFDVNAYTDEPVVKTTLLEGAVSVKRENNRQVLSPGQQAAFNTQGGISLVKDVDTGQETAWINGYFWFDNTDIYTLMRQVSRWYDVEVSFRGKITEDGFSGKVSRNLPLSKLLKVLEQFDIHFIVEEKKITVLP